MATEVATQSTEELLPTATLIAKNITKSKGRTLKNAPTTAQLAGAITDVQINGTMKGVSSIVVTMIDDGWTFLDSGFFDTNANSQIDPIDLNFPDNSRFWWRLTQISPSGADGTIALTFLVRESVYLLHHMGPKKANRAKMTRAEFLKSLCKDVHEGPIEFYCKQLDKKQPIGKGSSTGTTTTKSASNEPKGKGSKTIGVGANHGRLMSRGSPLTQEQLKNANTILQVGEQLNAPHNALVAAMYAAMGENNLVIDVSNNGVFATTGDASAYNHGADLPAQAKGWFTGGTSFAASGIKLANEGKPPWMIANMVELNGAWLYQHQDSYAQHVPPTLISDAEALVTAAGAAGGGSGSITMTTTTDETYYYEIEDHELYWNGMLRLAGVVNWELFWDGNRLYYDSEQTLVHQKPCAQIHRDDVIVADWQYDWDVRQLATSMTLVLYDVPLEFRPGEVFVLDGFGPASSGSAAKPKPLPGRWLIQDLTRNGADQTTSYTLIQPDLPKMEPAPQTKTTSKTMNVGDGGVLGDGKLATAVKLGREAAADESANHNWSYTQDASGRVNDGHPLLSPPHTFDCSGFVGAVYKAAGLPPPWSAGYGGVAFLSTLAPNLKKTSTPVPGDICLFPDHTALFIGNGQVVNMGGPNEPYITTVAAETAGHGGVFYGYWHITGTS